jgi:hypothetical protein
VAAADDAHADVQRVVATLEDRVGDLYPSSHAEERTAGEPPAIPYRESRERADHAQG